MIWNHKSMSKTIEVLPGLYPLQLDYFQAGSLSRPGDGWLHRKTMPYSILVQTLEGSYGVTCRESCIKLLPGEAALIPAHTEVEFVHRGGKSGLLRSHWIHFRFTYHGLIDFLSFFDTPVSLPRHLSRKLRELIQKALALDKIKDAEAGRWVAEYSLAARLLELIGGVSRKRDDALRRLEKQRLRPVLHYIQGHLDKPLCVGDLAARSGLSPSRFHACFVEEFGLSPMRYVNRVRLETAARLLAGTGFKLERIAEVSGFADAFHLSHSFKKHYGMPPRAYRIQANA